MACEQLPETTARQYQLKEALRGKDGGIAGVCGISRDLHGPHDHQSLFPREAQTRVLDAYAGAGVTAADFTAAHLKTREQRFERGPYRLSSEPDNQTVIQVYRSRIDKASATQLFLGI